MLGTEEQTGARVSGGAGRNMEEAVVPDIEERRWAAAAHASGPIGLLLTVGLLGFVLPLAIWLAKRDTSEFVADQGREAFNFQVFLFLVHVGLWIFIVVTLGIGLLVALPAWLLLWLGEVLLGTMAAIRAYGGERYRYPFTLRIF